MPHPNAAANPRAVAQLEDARVTLARITEHSMSQDAREALGPLSTDFRDLYEEYTGRDLPPWNSGPRRAATSTAPRAWQSAYASLASDVTRMIGDASLEDGARHRAGARQERARRRRRAARTRAPASRAFPIGETGSSAVPNADRAVPSRGDAVRDTAASK
jgi:hypothetical protein